MNVNTNAYSQKHCKKMMGKGNKLKDSIGLDFHPSQTSSVVPISYKQGLKYSNSIPQLFLTRSVSNSVACGECFPYFLVYASRERSGVFPSHVPKQPSC